VAVSATGAGGRGDGVVASAADEAGALRAVSDYVEGWFDGDATRMERALHPEFVKRCRGIEGDDPDALETLSAREMIDATADGVGRLEDAADRKIEIKIDHLEGGVASVLCLCHRYVDLLHLIDMPDGWKIVNAAWRLR
jgi:Putative lumazine-binding